MALWNILWITKLIIENIACPICASSVCNIRRQISGYIVTSRVKGQRYIKELHYAREAGSGFSVDPKRDPNNHYILKYSEVVGSVTVENCIRCTSTYNRYKLLYARVDTVFFQAFIVMLKYRSLSQSSILYSRLLQCITTKTQLIYYNLYEDNAIILKKYIERKESARYIGWALNPGRKSIVWWTLSVSILILWHSVHWCIKYYINYTRST